ncbi:MAG: DUF167 domain-containing protein [Chloroflexi bacterium]|nr:DUF167 domain-containing protein [Chloroflexota bacterium]
MLDTQPVRILRRIGPQSRFHQGRGGAALAVQIRFGGREEAEVVWLGEGMVRVTLWHRAAAGAGSLDRHLVAVLSRHLRVPRSRIEIVAQRGRYDRVVAFYGLTPQELERRLRRWR